MFLCPPVAVRRSPLRVMIADDDALMRLIVRHVVGAEPDVEVVAEAHSGATALELALGQLPDLLILDYELGDMVADAVVAGLRQAPRRPLIVLHSGLPQVHQIGRRLGVTSTVCKADGTERLLDAVRTLAGQCLPLLAHDAD